MKKYLILIAALFTAMGINAQEEGEKLIYEKEWADVAYDVIWEGYDGDPCPWASTGDGLAITTYHQQNGMWTIYTCVTDYDRLTLEKGHNYVVRLTLKVPSDGTYYIGLGDMLEKDAWSTSEVSVAASDDFQVVDIEFHDFPNKLENNGYAILGSGKVVGTTILKKVEVFDKSTTSSVIKAMKERNNMAVRWYSISGQQLKSSNKGINIIRMNDGTTRKVIMK